MAEPFGTGTGILGVISLAIQITQVVVQFGMDWTDAPDNVKTFMAELGALKTVLSETNTNLLLNPDFAIAFQKRPSLLISQLGPLAPSTTDTKLLIETCHENLECLLEELKKRGQGHRLGWQRLKGAFLARNIRDSVENLYRQCQALNNMLSIDVAVIGATILKEVRDERREQQEWRQRETETSLDIKMRVDQSNRWQESEECQAILDWLTPIDYAAQQSDFIGRRQAGTGQWLLDSVEFKTWLNTEKQTLLCPGIPGAGKTILTSIIVEELATRFHSDDSIGIAYLYCNFRSQDGQKAGDLVASLLMQLTQKLIRSRCLLPDNVKSIYDRHKDKRTRPSMEEISKALQAVATLYSRTFIIVDALDECQVSDGSRTMFLSEMLGLQERCGANLLATSRFMPDTAEKFKQAISLEICASDEDVRRYLDGNMFRLPGFVVRRPELQEEIKSKIVQSVQGMFLLAQLHLDSLIGKRSTTVLRNSLMKLPTGSQAYDHAYKDAMDRIEGQVRDQEELAKQVLSWITCARRPLTTLELQHALGVEVGKPVLDDDNIPEVEDIVAVCAGLVTVDEKSNIIRLVHYTTQEYFQRTWRKWFPTIQTDISTTCVTYLSFDVFESGACETDSEFEQRMRLYCLYDYASKHWGHHACKLPILGKHIIEFLQSEAKVEASSQVLLPTRVYSRSLKYSRGSPMGVRGLHLAAWFGIEKGVQTLLGGSNEPDLKDSQLRSPLFYAAEAGQVAVIKLLLEYSAELDAKDSWGNTPMSRAAMNGHEAVVKLLLEHGAMLEVETDPFGKTPLLWAAEKGHEVVVKLLLEHGAKFEAKDNVLGQTSLFWAAKRGHKAAVKLLLEYGAELDVRDKVYDETPLLWASMKGHGAVVKLLLEHGAMLDAKDKSCKTSLLWAASEGFVDVVKLLLEHGANLEVKDNLFGQTPLLWAASKGFLDVVKLLLEHGAQLEAKDILFGQTTLFWAAKKGHKVVAKLLLEKGAELDAMDTSGATPLVWAAEAGFVAVVNMLLEHGAKIEARDESGKTPLSWAAERGHNGVVKLLLDHGAKLQSTL